MKTLFALLLTLVLAGALRPAPVTLLSDDRFVCAEANIAVSDQTWGWNGQIKEQPTTPFEYLGTAWTVEAKAGSIGENFAENGSFVYGLSALDPGHFWAEGTSLAGDVVVTGDAVVSEASSQAQSYFGVTFRVDEAIHYSLSGKRDRLSAPSSPFAVLLQSPSGAIAETSCAGAYSFEGRLDPGIYSLSAEAMATDESPMLDAYRLDFVFVRVPDQGLNLAWWCLLAGGMGLIAWKSGRPRAATAPVRQDRRHRVD